LAVCGIVVIFAPMNVRWSVFLILFGLIVAACGGDYERRLQQLYQLQADNRADSLMTNDTLARDLVDYFDRHGTPNDRLLAYYLLGRTYSDLGQVPQALETYRTAATKADTTAADCDFATLSRVHAQTAELFYSQLLAENMKAEDQQAIYYAWKGRDTLMSINCLARLAEAYELMEEIDSALSIQTKAYKAYTDMGLYDYASALGCSMANLFLQKGDIQQAGRSLYEYRQSSGLFMEDGSVEQGREVYYYIKGVYHVRCSQPDSANFYFRKLLSSALDAEQTAWAYKGLRLLYEEIRQPDSLIKYSRLSDSIANIAHREVEMQTTLQTQAQYDYTHSQNIAKEKTKEASRANIWLIVVVSLLLLFFLLSIPVILRVKKKTHQYGVEQRIKKADVTAFFKQSLKSNPYQIPDYDKWKELRTLVEAEIPSFRTILNGKDNLSEMEYDVCILIRAGFKPSDIARLKQCSPAYITKIRTNLYKQLTGKTGSPDDFDDFIKGIE